MQDQPNRPDSSTDPDELESLVLGSLLDDDSHGPWTVQELALQFGEIAAIDAVTNLHAAGLVHLCHELVFPTRPAARCFRISRGL
jgi:hypothetical protein